MILICIFLIWLLIGNWISRLQRDLDGRRLLESLDLQVETLKEPDVPVRWYFNIPIDIFFALPLIVIYVIFLFLKYVLCSDFCFDRALRFYVQNILGISDGVSVFPFLSAFYPYALTNNSLNNQQLKSIGDLVFENKIPTIVMGDLNSTPWGLGCKSLIDITKLRDPRRDFGILPTWPADKLIKKAFSIPIDHILVSEDFNVLNLQVDPAPGSDHKMIIADIK